MAKSTVVESCTCGLEAKPEIWLCPICHAYRKGSQQFTSVTKVIKKLLPADYAAVDPTVLEIARLRGVFVDTYFSEWLIDPAAVMDLKTVREMVEPQFPRDGEKHSEDVVTRISRLLDWWNASKMKLKAVQGIVHSVTDGVAGTFDLGIDAAILDLKCVSQLQPNYALQLGAYLEYDTGLREQTGIIHVTKDKVKLVTYDAAKCRKQWRSAIAWFRTVEELS